VDKPAEILTADLAEAPASTQDGCAGILAGLLAELVHAGEVRPDSHFFDDLGADSMVMAHFCARVRKRADLPSVSMRDVYQHPTIASLAAALEAGPPPASVPAQAPAPGLDQEQAGGQQAAGPAGPARPQPQPPASSLQYVLCGTIQLLFFLGYCYVAALVATRAYNWIIAASGPLDLYLRGVAFGAGALLAVCTIPIAAKWILVGRWKPGPIRVWSLGYVRFWMVKTLVRSSPLALLFVGTPIYPLYLRALGARIGRHVTISSRSVPICTDLLTIGSGTIIRREAVFLCYRAHDGKIEPGPVSIGSNVLVGEKTVLDTGTSIGDSSQLGHSSALHPGQAVPAGQRWHGSPAQPAEVDYLRVGPARCGSLRRFLFCASTLLLLFLVYLPLAESLLYLLLRALPAVDNLVDPATDSIASWGLYLDALVLSVVLFSGSLLAGLVVVATGPRLLNLLVKPDRVYPLYGFHYRVHRAITRLTSNKFFLYLFGDSSYIVHYLRYIGYDLSKVEQTGSNFGTDVAHVTPYLTTVGSGTMVADGLSVINADYSSTSFRVSRASIGPRNFLGNNIAYPSGGRTGENCLLATKAMIPLDGKIREGVGLLGSPSFEIPRSVERDSRFDDLHTGDQFRRSLAAKNRYNIKTMGVFLFARWLHFFLLTVIGLAAYDLYGALAEVVIAGFFALSLLASPVYFVLAERILLRFRSLKPQYCSIYDRYFWWHERLWKVPATHYLTFFDGTPFKPMIYRRLGARIGKKVFDDGFGLTERTLAAVGDYCTLNFGSQVQCHSQEDGTFKSDRSTIGSGCTIGVGAFVHYGVTVGDGAELAPDSFLMKGEEMPQNAYWGGNPAREMS
jgi:non-ribosomal peptide synthetase-like protein